MATVPQQNQSSGVNTMPLIVFGGLSLAFGFLMWLVFPSLGTLPEAASTQAEDTDALFRVLMGIGGVVFFLVQGLIYYAAIAFRAKPNDTSDGPNIHGNFMLELVWTLVPSVIVVFLAIYSYTVWIENTSAPTEPNVMFTEFSASDETDNIAINAIGQRYAWSFQYITNDFMGVLNEDDSITENAGPRIVITTGDLFIYAGQEVDINMDSRDVIHSFWAPEMRVKQDLLPGRTTNILFNPQAREDDTWDSVMVHTPVTVYTEASLESEVLFEVGTENEAPVTQFEFTLADAAADTNYDGETLWVSVLSPRGVEGFLPVDADTTIGRFNRYRLICTELCGGGHGDMFTDIVMFENQETFLDVWYVPTINRLSVPAGDPIELGANVINNHGCAGCHVLESQGWVGAIGPTLDGIGSRSGERAEESGEAIGNEVDPNAEYIVQSIRLSQDYRVRGYDANMPYFTPSTGDNVMPRQELMGIVAYLCTQTDTGNPMDSDCGFINWEFDNDGNFTGDVDGLVAELLVITEDYED